MERSDPRALLIAIARILKKLRIPYIITGGIAVLVWGRPRFTADIDIVVELDEARAENLKIALLDLDKAGYLDEDVMLEALQAEGEFNFIDGESGVKVDFWLLKKQDSFDRERLKRKRAKKVFGEIVYFSSPEDLILMKLKWYKESGSSRQLEDIDSIIKISGKKLDFAYLEGWARKWGAEKILEDIREDRCLFCNSGKKYKECHGR